MKLKKNIIKRKNKIIIEAIDLLDEAGIQGLTTKEIAKRQGITEPAIYRQFASKKEIIQAILDEYAKYDQTIRSTLNQQKMTFEEKIIYYVNSYTEYYEGYPEITIIMFSADVYRYDDETYTRMLEILQARDQFLIQLVTKAIEEGEVKKTCDPEAIADFIHSTIWWYTYKWRFFQAEYSLKKRIGDTVKSAIAKITTG